MERANRTGAVQVEEIEREPRSGWVGALIALVFVCVAVGLPLIGLKVFSGTDLLYHFEPWVQSHPADEDKTSLPLSDTFDAGHPAHSEVSERLIHGDLALTSDLSGGGTSLASTPVTGWADPFNVTWYVLPDTWAPGWSKFLEMAAAAGFTYLFCRRLGLSMGSSWLGGLAFAGSGFEVVWTNWPHARAGALLPALFWATERYLQRRRLSDAALLSGLTAWQLLAGFPAVVLYTFTLLGPYVLVRTIIIARKGPTRMAVVGQPLVLAGAACLGVALIAPQVAGLADLLGETDLSAREAYGGPLPTKSIVTLVFPNAFGQGEISPYLGPLSYFDIQSFAGVAVLGLAAISIIRLPPSRLVLGARSYFAAAAAFLLVAVYFGGPALPALNLLPFYSTNPVGRMRVVIGFCLAVLAAIGTEALVDPAARRAGRDRFVAISLVALGGFVAAIAAWTVITPIDERIRNAVRLDVIAAIVAGLLLFACVVWARAGVARSLVPVALCGVVAVAALVLILPLWPRIDTEDFYGSDPSISAAVERQGLDRVDGDRALWSGATRYYGLRTATGHQYFTDEWVDLLKAVDPNAFRSTSFAALNLQGERIASPILDRLSVRHVMRPVWAEIPGVVEEVPLDADALVPGEPIEIALASGAMRGLSIPLTAAYDAGRHGAVIEVELVNDAGEVRATGRGAVYYQHGIMNVPVAAEGVAEPVTLRIRFAGPAPAPIAGGASGTPAIRVVRPQDDGLELWSSGTAALYERTTALPRYRFVSRAEVVADPTDRLARLAAGVPDDVVLLDAAVATGDGGTGHVVSVDQHDSDRRTIVVESDGAGFLVIADAFRDDWSVSVDDEPADLLRADHALMAVAVPSGTHTIRLTYEVAGWPATGVVALVALLVLVAFLVLDRVRPGPRSEPETVVVTDIANAPVAVGVAALHPDEESS
jgi:hypothetical protein